MNVAFRTDASNILATGHVMRCLAFAQVLRQEGINCSFVCREHPKHLFELIETNGFPLLALSAPKNKISDETDIRLGVTQSSDADETIDILGECVLDWMIVDHYALDAEWETRISERKKCRIFVIDDLADKRHNCSVLLNPNLGIESSHYEGLLSLTSEVLIGPKYAILRDEFIKKRPESLQKRSKLDCQYKRLLIAMGGLDSDNLTGWVLGEIERCGLPIGWELDVVLGAKAPALTEIQKVMEDYPIPCALHVNTESISELMCKADLAIGAAGSTSWERCALGLPSLLAVTSDNQIPIANALSELGAARLFSAKDSVAFRNELTNVIMDNSWRKKASAIAFKITDGDGARRAKQAIIDYKDLKLRVANIDDTRMIWECRRSQTNQNVFLKSTDEDYTTHSKWVERAIFDEKVFFYIIEEEGNAIGYLRFNMLEEQVEEHSYIVSICLFPGAQGRGIGRRALAIGSEKAEKKGATSLIAHINSGNYASAQIFESCGYVDSGMEGRDTSLFVRKKSLR